VSQLEIHGPVDEFNDFESLLRRYDSAIDVLRQHGVRISEASRLAVYRRHLASVISDPRPALEWHTIVQLAFDLREVDEIIEIADHLPDRVDAGIHNLLRILPGGTVHPDDEKSASAREAQYELYLGTVLRRAGFPAVHGAPDLTVTVDRKDYLIEAKRPSSLSKVDDRLRSAVHQLRGKHTPGVIALSLDQVIRPRKTLLGAPQARYLAPDVAARIQLFVTQQRQMWRNRLKGENAAAVILTARIPARLESTGHLSLGTNIDVERLVDGDVSDFASSVARAYLDAQKPSST
jgi:hypothetical protein